MKQEIKTIEDDLVRLFQELVSGLPVGCAELSIKRRPEIEHDGVSIWLRPSNPQAAQIVVDAENGDSTVCIALGVRTPSEVLPCRSQTVLDQVKDVCQAVFDGKFEEELWVVGSEVTKCVARIEYGGRTHVYRYYDGLFPFRKKERKVIRYSPYCLSDP